jgi:hypothetical protein
MFTPTLPKIYHFSFSVIISLNFIVDFERPNILLLDWLLNMAFYLLQILQSKIINTYFHSTLLYSHYPGLTGCLSSRGFFSAIETVPGCESFVT